ncbi:hypothetical protein Vafri_8174, partial [Volvox africanus]
MKIFSKCFGSAGDRREDYHSRFRGALSSETRPETVKSTTLNIKTKTIFISPSLALDSESGGCLPHQSNQTAHPVAAHNRALKALREAERAERDHIRNELVLRYLPAMITMVAAVDGRILHQNPQSKAYYGDRTRGHGGANLHTNILDLLFAYEPAKLESMLEAMASQCVQGSSGPWKAVVRVPHTLNVPPVLDQAQLYDGAFSCGMRQPSASEVQHNDTPIPGASPRTKNLGHDNQPSGIARHFEEVAALASPTTVLAQLECEPHSATLTCGWAESTSRGSAKRLFG